MTIRYQDAHQLSTSHFGFFGTLHLWPRQSVLSVQKKRWYTYNCTIFLHPHHKPSRAKYEFHTYFIYIKTSKMKSISVTLTHFTFKTDHRSMDNLSKKVQPLIGWLEGKGNVMRTSILELFLLKDFIAKYFQRTSRKWPWMSKLKASWPGRIWTKKVCLTFSAHSEFLMNTDGLLKKDFPRDTDSTLF